MNSITSKKISPEARIRIHFFIMIAVVIASIIGMLILGGYGMQTLSSLRAFVGGESIYSKQQHGGSFNLLLYAQTGDEIYYQEFLEHMQLPLADRKARLELEKSNPDLKSAFAAFKVGGNNPDDIDGMIDVFLMFRNFDLVDRAINAWARSDEGLIKLMAMGDELHRVVQLKETSSKERDTITARLDVLTHELHLIEEEFSNLLGDVSRWAKGLFMKAIFGFALITLIVCLFALRMVSKMISNMQLSANKLETQNWLKSGQTALNEKTRNDQDITELSSIVISTICEHLGAGVGAFYICEEESALYLKMMGGYAFEKRKGLKNSYKPGEGLVGQAALEKKPIIITNCPEDYIHINSGLGNSIPRNILAYPLVHNDEVKGVIELGSFNEFTDLEMEYLHLAAETVAIAVGSVQARRKVAVLLEKTQQQTEELTAQQEELRATNEELEEHTRSLKESEQRLQVQQEELRVTNEELTEQAQSLEEQKEEIETKNRELDVIRRTAEEKAEELEITGKYKSEFLANMSHELRTPLNSVLLLSKLLGDNKNGNLTEKEVEFAQTVHSSGTDLLNLINEVLDLSKVEAGKVELNIEEFTLERFAEKVQRTYGKIIEEKGLDFKIDIQQDIPSTIHTDFQRLEQIVKNLISNSIKFTEKGGISLTIGRPVKDDTLPKGGPDLSRMISFSVTDTGIGIEKNQQRIIFEAFQQADGSTSRKYGGTGLGLSISRELAAYLGGTIQLKSKKGEGSTFTLVLPERFASATDVANKASGTAVYNEIPEETVLEPAVAELLPSKDTQIDAIRDDRHDWSQDDKSLLIIEDDPVFLKTLRDLAQDKGFKVLVAGDGETGLHLADYYKPSAIILDVGLPGIDGWNVMIRLKESSETRHIPVHFISGTEKGREAMRMGAVGYLLKPVSLEQINRVFSNLEDLVESPVKNLMVVGDNETENTRIKEMLLEKDLAVETVSAGSEAILRLKEKNYHCIILGLTLSDMEGTAFLGQIRQDDTISHIPVIVYTGKELSSDERVFLDSHSERIITKDPKSLERLLDETILFLHRLESNLPEDKRRILSMAHDRESIFKDKKILIVDDDIRNVFALTSILENKGIKVVAAKDGHEGVSRVKENADLDLVLMDIMMPRMDGYEATKKIREMKDFKHLPIIALTAKAMRGDRAKCIAAGASDYLSKPVDDDKLFSILRVWLYR